MRKNNFLLIVLLIVCFVTITVNSAVAKQVQKLEIPNGESKLIEIDNLGRVAVGNPEIADVIAISNQELLINGRSTGATTVHIWDQNGLKLYKVKITKEQSTILNRIRQLIKYSTVKVAKIDNTILLTGKLDNQNQSQRVEEIAKVFAEEVVNQIQVQNSLQVLLEAQVFEIDKTVDNQLGIDWYGVGSQAGTKLDSGTVVFDENLPQGTKFGLGSFERISKIQAKMKALMERGNAKLLAKPKLVTKSGQEAKFVVGGEIPVVTTDAEGKQTVTWRQYGVQFTIKPQVTRNGKLDTYLNPRVSRLDWANAVDYGNGQLPAIKSSEVNTKVVIPDGDTVAIGGLIQNYKSENIQKIPVLGDIPILGALFKSKEYQQRRSELLILVTPKIIKTDQEAEDLMGLDNVFKKKKNLEFNLKSRKKSTEK